MRFRTEIEIPRNASPIAADSILVSMGSCFSQAIGKRLADGGIKSAVTPMGILFNPISIGYTVKRMLHGFGYTKSDLYQDQKGIYHALAFESRRQGPDPVTLLEAINLDFLISSSTLRNANCWLITFGTAWCFRHIPSDVIVGNCHKLNASEFEHSLCRINEIFDLWHEILPHAPRVIFTVSPVRHLNDGLHGNTISKSILHLAIDRLCKVHKNAEYFPAYEALVDDLRDYRFYADDLKHPSPMAEEYIFDLFLNTYFSERDITEIKRQRRQKRIENHRPILK